MALLRDEDLRHVARLARIRVEEDEIPQLRAQLSAILEHMQALDQLDLSGAEPSLHLGAEHCALRTDEPRPSLRRSEALDAAPQGNEVGFAVPKVLDAK